MIYKAAVGSTLTDEQAQKYGPCIATIAEKNNGNVNQQAIVDEAVPKTSELHGFFEWNNKRAAEKYRLRQAGHLLRSIHVVVERDENAESIRAFHNVYVETEDPEKQARVYVHIKRVLGDADLLRQVIQQAMNELEAWKARYEQYKNAKLNIVFLAIEKAVEEIEV